MRLRLLKGIIRSTVAPFVPQFRLTPEMYIVLTNPGQRRTRKTYHFLIQPPTLTFSRRPTGHLSPFLAFVAPTKFLQKGFHFANQQSIFKQISNKQHHEDFTNHFLVAFCERPIGRISLPKNWTNRTAHKFRPHYFTSGHLALNRNVPTNL